MTVTANLKLARLRGLFIWLFFCMVKGWRSGHKKEIKRWIYGSRS